MGDGGTFTFSLAAAWLLGAVLASPAAAETPVTGFVRLGGAATWITSGGEAEGMHGMGFGRARIGASPSLGGGLVADLALDVSGAISDVAQFSLFPGVAGAERDDHLTVTLVDGGKGYAEARVDRLSLTASGDRWKVVGGRQPIGFGTTRFFGVMDFVTPVSAFELDRDTRPGCDALRGEWSFGMATEAGLLWLPAQSGRGAQALATARANAAGVDLHLLGGRVGGRGVLSGAVEGELLGAGLRLEAARWWAGGEGEEGDATIVTLGADGRLPIGVTVAAEWYVRFGEGAPSGGPPADLSRHHLVPFAGERYLGLSLSRALHPLVGAEAAAIVNLDDGSFMAWPSLRVSLADNADAVVAVYWPSGEEGTEYGDLPTAVMLRGTWYY